MTRQPDNPCPADASSPAEAPAPASHPEPDAAIKQRRELLKKIAKYGVYTGPAFLAVFAAQKRAFAGY